MDVRNFFGKPKAKAAGKSPDKSPGGGGAQSKFFAGAGSAVKTDIDAPARVAKRKAEELAAEAAKAKESAAKSARAAKIAAAMGATVNLTGGTGCSPSENVTAANKKGSPSPAKKPKTADVGSSKAKMGAGGADAGDDPYGFKPTASKRKWHPGAGAGITPPNAGTKTAPKGKPGCLSGKNFCITGVLDSLEREEAEQLVQQYGGTIKSGVSGLVHFLLAGPLLEDGRALATT